MKQYDSYKDSGIEWIGKIPSHWEVRRLKFFALELTKGNGITKEEIFQDGDTPCVRYGEIYSTYNESFVECVSKTRNELHQVKRYFNYGDILFAGTGELIDEIGKNIVYLGDSPCLAGGDIIILKHYQNPTFFNYLLNSQYAQCQKSCGKAKLKVVHISSTEIGNINVALPPLSEQLFIANYLDAETNHIDSIIASREKKIKLLEELRASIITQAVTKGIRKDVKQKDSGIEWIGQIPKHWEIMKVSHIFRIIGSGTTPKTTVNEYYSETGTCWLQTGELKDGLIKETSKKVTSKAIKELGLTIYPRGSVVVAMYGATIGKVGILDIETATNQACCVLANSILMKPLFAFYTIRAAKESLVSLSYGGGQPNISQEKIRSHKLPVPPLVEQDRIVAFIKEKMMVLESNIDKARREIELLKEYRASLITEVVTGKRKVTN